ncbi:thioredoxin domain-containing protein [Sphingopyxis sp. GW247-27LB]|uniref:DsbA family protein n=1 Tax=Sphingopyxis sp. GW247-27LB TaxID=2012632 RepID=UPI000BA726D1|nr:thioredoxin domain-containing protein [Sphingopyxis sp. GW247-27LB]PAL22302.1 disulfide bond formation protein DsbA [Sphingopyxis sp. GW247-27LB]
MTDKKEEYYQPWLRDPTPTQGAAPAPKAEEGLAKPKDGPPVGIDLTRYEARAETPRDPLIKPERIRAGAAGFWSAVRNGAGAFADWTIRAGERADIPARVEAMEIPRRSREAAAATASAVARGARAVGRGSAKAGRAAAATSGKAWDKMALGDKARKLSSEAGRGLGEVADKTKAGLGQVAKAGKDGLGEAATKLRPAPREEPAPPPSGLEQLLAREEAEARKAKPAAADLPLFADAPPAAAGTPSAPPALAEDDDRTPHIAPASPAKAPQRTKAMTATPPARVQGTSMDDFRARGWLLALGAILLVGAAFWLGGRFGGGMSKAEVETIVADYIRANPQIIPEALEAQRGREIAKAIGAIRPALEKPYAGAWAGNADGDVTLVVFTDYACGFCRASVPDVDRLIREDKRLKVVFRELPIISAQSRDAALMALAAARQGKYDAFHHAMFAASSLDRSAIAAAAQKAGVITDGSADATANEALFQRELDSNLAIASQLQLNATPTWVVGDQLFQGQVGYDALRQAIAKARSKA